VQGEERAKRTISLQGEQREAGSPFTFGQWSATIASKSRRGAIVFGQYSHDY
jgi:hypothetical protein